MAALWLPLRGLEGGLLSRYLRIMATTMALRIALLHRIPAIMARDNINFIFQHKKKNAAKIK